MSVACGPLTDRPPQGGEPVLVEDIWQVGTWGRETYDRPGRAVDRVVEAVAAHLERIGFACSQIGLFGDSTSVPYWDGLKARLSRTRFVQDRGIIERMQRRRTKREQAIVRAAAQLADIGIQAAYHVTRPGVTDREIYAAFTYAQMARGGEWGMATRSASTSSEPTAASLMVTCAAGRPHQSLHLQRELPRYSAQIARMIAVGDITDKQEEVLQMCVDGVEAAAAWSVPAYWWRTSRTRRSSPISAAAI